MDNKIKLADFPLNKQNPFMGDVVEVVNSNIVKKFKAASNTDEKAILRAVDPNSGEIMGVTSFIRQVEVDEDQFVKIYLSNFQQFFNLSTAALRVFGYFINNVQVGSDLVLFSLEEASAYTQYKSKASIYKGIAELLKANIIARGATDERYYINPMCAFNGNRINFVKSYVKKNGVPHPEQKQIELPFVDAGLPVDVSKK